MSDNTTAHPADANREARIVAQVACEYIGNHPDAGWEPATMRIVLDQAIAVGVAPGYTDMLAVLLEELCAACGQPTGGLAGFCTRPECMSYGSGSIAPGPAMSSPQEGDQS